MPPNLTCADDICTHPQAALKLLEERRAQNLHGAIALALDIPNSKLFEELDRKGPVGITYRDVTPNFEQHRFLSICDLMGLDPFILENPEDKFVTLNRSKYQMGKMVFFEGFGKKGGAKTHSLRVVDLNGAQGKPMCCVPTISSRPLSDFHRQLFLETFPHCEGKIYDAKQISETSAPSVVYEKIFTLAIAHGVLLEHFLPKGIEETFTRNVVMPAFLRVWERYGHKPLVVPFQPTDMEEDDFWLQYPAALSQCVRKHLPYNTATDERGLPN